MQLNKLVPALKENVLQNGASVNVDETWLRYYYNTKSKTYICSLAHARAKFKYAYDQGSLQTRIFLELIVKLYGMEETNPLENLLQTRFTAEGINNTELRNL